METDKFPGRISAQSGPLAEARKRLLMNDALKKGFPPFERGGRLTACGCVHDTIAVRSDGVITPCMLLPHIELGQINSNSLKDIWQNSFALNNLRYRSAIPLSNFEFCENCSYMPYGLGNYPAIAYGILGQVDHPSSDSCLRQYLNQGGRLPFDSERIGAI